MASALWTPSVSQDALKEAKESGVHAVSALIGLMWDAAYRRSTLTYTQVLNFLGMKVSWSSDRYMLGDWLYSTADYSKAEWGIVLATLVVSKGDGMPSGRPDPADPSGFWSWAVVNGYDISDPRRLVLKEQARCFAKVEALMGAAS